MAIDPVCTMEVDPSSAAATSNYGGQTFYFCAPGCKEKFDSDPEKYLKGGTAEMKEPQKEGFFKRLFTSR